MLKIKNLNIKLLKFELKNIAFEVNKNEYFVILGKSGVGKSVLLEAVAGLIEIDSGEIWLNNKNISAEKIQKRKVGLVYQGEVLFPHLSVFENIAFPLKIGNKKNKIKKTEIIQRVTKLAELVGVSQLLDRNVETLSGGEYQRVSIARTIASEPQILLLDEPISSLDVSAKREMRFLLRKLNRNGITILHVTHDYDEAISLANRIAVMEKGTIVQIDKPEYVFNNPRLEFIANFVGINNFLSGEIKKNNNEIYFQINEKRIFLPQNIQTGKAFLSINPEHISVSASKSKTSERNHFIGKVIDIAPNLNGVEITVDSGFEIKALITKHSFNMLNINIDSTIWINFKATACKIYEKN